MVDKYVPLFFLEISNIKPDDICQKVDLCQKVVSISQQFSQNGCDLCHQVVSETLSKLKDPDTQVLFDFHYIHFIPNYREKEKKEPCIQG